MRGVALNERVRASVKEPGRVETGKSRLYLPEDLEGWGWKSRLPTGGRRVQKAPRRLLRPSFPSLSPAPPPPPPTPLDNENCVRKQCHLQRRGGKRTPPSGPRFSCTPRPRQTVSRTVMSADGARGADALHSEDTVTRQAHWREKKNLKKKIPGSEEFRRVDG